MPATFHGRSEYNRSYKWFDGLESTVAAPTAGKESFSMYQTCEPPLQRKARSPSPVRDSIIFNEPFSSERSRSNRQDDYFLLGATDKFSSSLPYRNSAKNWTRSDEQLTRSRSPGLEGNIASEHERHHKERGQRHRPADGRVPHGDSRHARSHDEWNSKHRMAVRDEHATSHVDHRHHSRSRSKDRRRQRKVFIDTEADDIIATPDAPRARRKSVAIQTQQLGRRTATEPPPTVNEPRKYGSYNTIPERAREKSRGTVDRRQYRPFVYDTGPQRRNQRHAAAFRPRSASPGGHRNHAPSRRYVTEYSAKFQPADPAHVKTQLQRSLDVEELQMAVEANRQRNRGTHLSRDHLGQIMSNSNGLWTAPIDTPPGRYDGYPDDEENVAPRDASYGPRSQSPMRIPETDGRLPTPRMQESFTRHHLDRTTPAVGGALLTHPSSRSLDGDACNRVIMVGPKRSVTFSQPVAGRPSFDSFELRDETAPHDTPLRLSTSFSPTPGDMDRRDDKARSFSSGSSSSRSSKSSKSSQSSTSRSSRSTSSSYRARY